MISIFHSGVPMRRDARWTNPILITAAAVASMVSVAGPAFAQELGAPGAYGVVRSGAQLDSDLKFPKQPASPAAKPGTTPPRSPARTIPPGFSRDVDAKAAFTGELGAGYDFGGFRLEGTVGYGSAKIDASTLGDRAKMRHATPVLLLDESGGNGTIVLRAPRTRAVGQAGVAQW